MLPPREKERERERERERKRERKREAGLGNTRVWEEGQSRVNLETEQLEKIGPRRVNCKAKKRCHNNSVLKGL